jgi:hypothetical protein
MAGFKRAIGPDGHVHVVFLNDDVGTGVASPAEDGHTPMVQYQPAQEPQVDEMGNEIAPAVPGGWIVADPNGQPHQLEEIPVVIKSKKTKETVRDVWAMWRATRASEVASLEKIEKYRKFYAGEQWNDGDKTKLEGMSRAALTVNMSAKQVDELSGVERQQRTEFKLLPVEASDQRATDMYQALVKQVANQSYYSISKSSGFKDALIGGRGWLNLSVDFTEDVLGTINIERWKPEDITVGPHDDLTLKDCEVMFKEKWYSLERLKSEWGKKVKELEADFDFMSTGQSTKKHERYLSGGQYAKSDNWMPIGATFEGEAICDVTKKNYRVLERWQRVYQDVVVVGNVQADYYTQAIGWPEADLEAIRQIPGCIVIERNMPKIRITRVAGNVMLSDENPADLPSDNFFCVPIYAYKDGDTFYGKMHQMYDLQLGINKMFSLSVDILNKMSSWNVYYDSTTFPDNEKENFKEMANQPGAVIEVTNVDKPPKREEGTRFPSEITQHMELQLRFLESIGNVTPEPPGANTSAQAILQRQKQLMKGNEELFDNLSLAQQSLGRLLLKTIKRYYPPERILRVLQQAAVAQKFMVGDRTFDEWSREEIIEILEKSDIEKYDLIVSEADSSPSAMLGTNLLLSELAGKGMAIPPEALIETSPLPEKVKERLLGYIQSQNEAQSQGNQVAADAEIKKTLIAKGIIPPDVQQQYLGMQPQGGMGMGQPIAPNEMGQPPAPMEMPQQVPGVDVNQPQQMTMPQQSAMSESAPGIDQGGMQQQALASEMQNQQTMGMLQQMAASIQMLADVLTKKEAAPAQQPIINVVNGKPSMQVGRIVRDPSGLASDVTLRNVDTPEGM